MIKIVKQYDTNINVFLYKKQKTLQIVGVEKAFETLSDHLIDKPRTIIELGTNCGGLTNLLADSKISANAIIHTYDKDHSNFVSYSDKIIPHNKEIFSNENEIKQLIQNDGRTILLCDGGNKKKEFEVFHKYLKNGDIIMAHDYISTSEEFQNNYMNKIWNWHEFDDSHANFDGLKPFLQDVFAPYVWCIRIKDIL